MPPERLFKQALHAKVKEKRPIGRLRTRWEVALRILWWNRLGLPHRSEMMEMVADRDMWRFNLKLLSSQPSRTWADYEEDGICVLCLKISGEVTSLPVCFQRASSKH